MRCPFHHLHDSGFRLTLTDRAGPRLDMAIHCLQGHDQCTVAFAAQIGWLVPWAWLQGHVQVHRGFCPRGLDYSCHGHGYRGTFSAPWLFHRPAPGIGGDSD